MYWYMFRDVMLHECIGFFKKEMQKSTPVLFCFFKYVVIYNYNDIEEN